MRKFQQKQKPPRVKKYTRWWKRDGDFDVTKVEQTEDRMLVFGVFRGRSIVINLPNKCVFDTPMLIRYINAKCFFEVI